MDASDITALGQTLSADLIAWGAAAIGITIAYIGFLYIQRIVK